ncbi:MAG: RNA polymerase sigma factor [Anaerolineaceae bacterium]
MTFQNIDTETEELNLVNAARKDPRVFGVLYERYVNQVFRYLYSRTGNQQDAEDITAQTFLAAFESFERYRGNGYFGAWLFGIAKNKVNDHYRQSKSLVEIEGTAEVPDNHDLLSDAISADQSTTLQKLIQQLPEDEQELLRLRFLAELSYSKIALLLHRNEDAVKKSIYRLLARLQSQVEDHNE